MIGKQRSTDTHKTHLCLESSIFLLGFQYLHISTTSQYSTSEHAFQASANSQVILGWQSGLALLMPTDIVASSKVGYSLSAQMRVNQVILVAVLCMLTSPTATPAHMTEGCTPNYRSGVPPTVA